MKTKNKSTENYKEILIKEITRKLNEQDNDFYSQMHQKDVNVIFILFMQIIIESMAHAEIKSKLEITNNKKWKSTGTKTTKFKTLVGELKLNLPVVSGKIHKPRCIKKSKNICPRVRQIMVLLYSMGLSTQNITIFLSRIISINITKATVSNTIMEQLDKRVERFLNSKINCKKNKIVSISMDCSYFKVKLPFDNGSGKYVSTAVYIVNSRRENGCKQIIGIGISSDETKEKWTEILLNLKARGMNDPVIATRDGSAASLAALKSVFPNTDIQTCHFHFLASIKRLVENKKLSKEIFNDFEVILNNGNPSFIKQEIMAILEGKWNNYADDIKILLKDEYLFTYLKYDKKMYQFIRTNNSVENINQNLKIVSAQHKQYTSYASLFRALVPCLIHINANYTVEHMNNHRNSTLDHFNTVTNDFNSIMFTEQLSSSIRVISSKLFRIKVKVNGKKEKVIWIPKSELKNLLNLK